MSGLVQEVLAVVETGQIETVIFEGFGAGIGKLSFF